MKNKKMISLCLSMLLLITSVFNVFPIHVFAEENRTIEEPNAEVEEESQSTENTVSVEQPITSEEGDLISDTRATEESAFTFTETTRSIAITGYDVSIGGTDVVIPAMINGKPVKAIKDGAFQSKNLTSVVFPKGLETIGKYAFRNNAISNLTLPNSLKSIGWEGFVNAGIQTLTLPETMTTVPATSFGRNPIESLTIPDSVTNIDDNAFQGCSIKTINWGSGIKRIGNNAFQENKITHLNVTAETIENGAFYDNPLESVTLADSVRTVEGNAFYGNSNNKTLKNIDLGNGVEKIENNAFEYGVVERIKLPSSLKKVGRGVFGYQELPYIELNATNPKVSYGNQRLSPRKVNKKQQDTTVTVNLAEMYEGIDTSKVRIDKIYSGVSSTKLPFEYNKDTGDLTINDIEVSYVRLYYSYLSGSDVVLTVEQKLDFTNILTVKWNDYDDSNIQTDMYYRDYGTGYVTVTEAPRPVRDGYTFSNWLKDPFFVNHSLFEIEWSTTYKAIYTENNYKIAYDLDYETEETIPEKNVKWTSTGINAPTPRRENYIFDGWYYDNKKVENTDSVSSIVTQDPGNNSTITLTAKWRKPTSIPVITADDVVLTLGGSFDPIKDSNVSAFDKIDGPIVVTEDNIIFNDVNTNKGGTYHVTFEVTNKEGVTATKTIAVTVVDKNVLPDGNGEYGIVIPKAITLTSLEDNANADLRIIPLGDNKFEDWERLKVQASVKSSNDFKLNLNGTDPNIYAMYGLTYGSDRLTGSGIHTLSQALEVRNGLVVVEKILGTAQLDNISKATTKGRYKDVLTYSFVEIENDKKVPVEPANKQSD